MRFVKGSSMTLKEMVEFIIENDGTELGDGYEGLMTFINYCIEDEESTLQMFEEHIRDSYDEVQSQAERPQNTPCKVWVAFNVNNDSEYMVQHFLGVASTKEKCIDKFCRFLNYPVVIFPEHKEENHYLVKAEWVS